MTEQILDLKGIKVTKIGLNTVSIKVGRNWIYLGYEELAKIAEAVAQYAEPAAEEMVEFLEMLPQESL